MKKIFVPFLVFSFFICCTLAQAGDISSLSLTEDELLRFAQNDSDANDAYVKDKPVKETGEKRRVSNNVGMFIVFLVGAALLIALKDSADDKLDEYKP